MFHGKALFIKFLKPMAILSLSLSLSLLLQECSLQLRVGVSEIRLNEPCEGSFKSTQ